jgi:Tol biopolymer transport system component/DNA-binding winged helix-turn-helix (wHTH) protein
MPSQPTARRLIRFGLFELDLASGELSKQGRKIRLQDQPFQILELLLSRPGEVVTREELQKALWPTDTFVEFDQGLNTAIKKIRLALGDSADNPRFVETIPRKGYRFIAPVDGHEIPARPQRAFRLLWVAVVLGAIAVAGMAGWLLSMRSRPPEAGLVAVPLTTYPGNEGWPAFSPDGSQVAFDWDGGRPGAEGVYVKVIGLEPPVLVAKTPWGFPAWSPNGRFIAFIAPVPSGNCGVFLVPAVGGPARKLAEIDFSGHGEMSGHFIAWHPDGKWLAAMHKLNPRDSRALFLISSETGEKRRLTLPPKGSGGDHCPAFSPDGHAIVFQRIMSGEGGLHILELTDDLTPIAEPRRLTSDDMSFAVEPTWTADGRAIVFAGGAPHRTFLWRLEMQFPGWRPGRLERLAFAGDGAMGSAISRQGRLAFMRIPPTDTDIWRLDLGGERSAGRAAVRLISSTLLDHTPAYSPDGKRIAFASTRSGSHEIWASDADGGNLMQLTSIGPSNGEPYTANPRWSTDGRWIYFDSSIDARPGIYAISGDGGRPRLATKSEGTWTSKSRDERWIYFDSAGSGESQIWKKAATGGNAVLVTRHGGEKPFESPDGRFLYYEKPSDAPCGPDGCASIWKVPVGGGEERQIVKAVSCGGMNFAVGERGVYFNPDDDPPTVQFLNFATNHIEKIADLGEKGTACGFSLSPDGRWLIYALYEPTAGSDLMLVEKFR